ncbi:MAG: hypothetical protein JWN34_2682 [Bryobacterales bacterium]|jgi:hypothetical protein|nr:hypothetical protein [Bryobacterales bacterium]
MVAAQRKLVVVRVLAAAILSLLLYDVALTGSAQDKFRLIQSGQPRAGARIVITPAELRQWLRDEDASWEAYGVSNIRLNLGTARATAYADVDFLKARKATTGQDAGWLLRNLFSGRKPIAVTARFTSANGRGRVDIERLEVSGIPVEGAALGLIVDEFVKPSFPDAKVGEWFSMDYRIERFAVTPAGVIVTIGK